MKEKESSNKHVKDAENKMEKIIKQEKENLNKQEKEVEDKTEKITEKANKKASLNKREKEVEDKTEKITEKVNKKESLNKREKENENKKAKLKNKKKKEKQSPLKWPITVAFIAFAVSFVFAYLSNTAIAGLDLLPGILVLLVVIIIGILFDLIGVSVTIAKEEEFHAMATKKIKGAKTAIKLIRNSAKVSNICADVVGDICGVISGAIGTMIALKIMESIGIGNYIQFIMSALVASITISGKALTKEFAKKNATKVLSILIKIIPFDE